MKIIKYKKITNGRYKVTLDDCEMTLYEEVILKYNLLISKEIDKNSLEEINKDNQYYEVYYSALNSLKSKYKSEYDIKEFLRKKEYSFDLIDKATCKLKEQGYLNDVNFAKSFINYQILTTNKGPNKFRLELLTHKIDENIIEKEISVFTEEEQLEKIKKLANKFLKSNKTRGGMVLKRKVMTDLINYGYNNYLIEKVLNELEFGNNQEIAKKEYEKLYTKLSRKYSGTELKNKIREKMYMKGLKYEE